MGSNAVLQAGQLELLVRGVDVVVVEPQSDEQRVDPQDLLDGTDGRDASTGPDEQCVHAEHALQRLGGRGLFLAAAAARAGAAAVTGKSWVLTAH